MSNFWNWLFPKAEGPSSTPMQDFDVMHIALPGTYYGRIEQARLRTLHQRPKPFVELKVRLHPEDPDDQSAGWILLSGYRYAKLLGQLGLKRTNDITVLEGQYITVLVEEASTPFSDTPMPKASLLEDILPEDAPAKPKRRSTRARTPRKTQ